MTTALLITLIAMDVALLTAVLWQRRRAANIKVELLEELTEERRLLTELRATVQEDLDGAQKSARATLDAASRLAAEAEHEVKHGGKTIASELESVASEVASRFEAPLKDLMRKQTALESLLRRVDTEKQILTRLVARGEKICRFFDERVPYQEVLEEIEDKKYADARALLARGQSPGAVARDLGLSEPEVRLIAGLSRG